MDPPSHLCKADGKWTLPSGGCRCKAGYEPNNEKQSCNVCPSGTFRSNEIQKCTPCPMNSKTKELGSPFCPCTSGHFRHPRDGKQMPCYKPPSPPTNLTLLFIDQTSAILSWNSPVRSPNEQKDSEYRNDIMFKVKCSSCNSHVVFNPSSETFVDTKITLTNLEPVTTYTVQIHSLNGPSYSINQLYSNSSVGQSDSKFFTDLPPTVSRAGSDINWDEIKTEYAEIMFTTESTILSTVINIK